jgi:hypothetical protein
VAEGVVGRLAGQAATRPTVEEQAVPCRPMCPVRPRHGLLLRAVPAGARWSPGRAKKKGLMLGQRAWAAWTFIVMHTACALTRLFVCKVVHR